jgi:lipopolysaccharide transport system permease protein
MNTMQHDISRSLELLVAMTEKELQARYKHTLFGFLWLVVNPILQMLIIGFVFTFFMKEPIEHYHYFLFTGLLVWNFFSLSLNKATPSIIFERSLIKKAAFPRAVIPISIVLSSFVHFILAFLLFLIPILILGTLTLEKVPYLIGATGFMLMFTIGISLLTSALNVRYRDVTFFVQALLLLWFYASPIIYSLSQVPPHLLWLWRLNPMTSVLQLFQAALLGAPAPGPAMLASNILIVIVITTLGILVFKDESKTFDDWV